MDTNIQEQVKMYQRLIQSVQDKVPALLFALIMLVIGVIIARVIRNILLKMAKTHTGTLPITKLFISIAYIVMLIVIFMMSLNTLGVATTSFAAILGAAGFSIGLAFKEVLANLGSSMIILFFKPFKIGDYISCNGVQGTVVDIQVFSTSLKTTDNKTVIVPSSELTSNNLTNFTEQQTRRIDFEFNVKISTDINLMTRIVEDVFANEKRLLIEPAPLIGVDQIDNNMVKFIAKPWVKTEDYWNVYYDLMKEFKYKFDENKIEFPTIFKIPN